MIEAIKQHVINDPFGAINSIAQVVLALIALFALIYAMRQYWLTRKRYIEDSRPYINIDLDRMNGALLNLVIINGGNSAAQNITIKFTPNIAIYQHTKAKINSHKFLKNLRFLASGKSVSFYFGSVMGGKTAICREFKILITYEDVEGHKFINEQTIDPRDFLNLLSINRKDIHDVAKTLEDIKKELKDSNSSTKDIYHNLQKGLTSRDASFAGLNFQELCQLLSNLLTVGIEDQQNTYPMLVDAKIIAKVARNKLLSKQSLSAKEKDVVKVLNKFESSDFDWSAEDIINEALMAIGDL